jgi:hypothetical protein
MLLTEFATRHDYPLGANLDAPKWRSVIYITVRLDDPHGMTVTGTKLPIRDVRYSVAVGGRPDMARTSQFGRD